ALLLEPGDGLGLRLQRLLVLLFARAVRPHSRQRWFAAASIEKNAVESVIVLSRNGVELVVMTARAGDRESQRAACDHVDPIVDGIMDGVAVAPASHSQEPEGGQMAAVVPFRQAVRGQLPQEKLVAGHVVVEGPDDPVA